MISKFHKGRAFPRELCLLALTVGSLVGCAESKGKKSGEVMLSPDQKPGVQVELSSSSGLLFSNETQKFQPGRMIDDILNDIHWRGHFIMAGECGAKSVCVIGYGFLATDYFRGLERDPEAEKDGAYAVFIDEKFVKFINGPPAETETIDYEGTKWSRPKPIKAGDCTWLVGALEAESINVADVEKEVRARPATPSHTDPGLTAAWLLLRRGTQFGASEDNFRRNAELRDQFNASRLRIGMTASNVESVLKAKPIESGKTESGDFRIYGSQEAFDITYSLHFTNILVIFVDGHVKVIRAAPPGIDWRRELYEQFLDLKAK